MRRAPVILAVVLVVLAGAPPVAAASPGGIDSAVESSGAEAAMQTTDNESAPPDPDSDRLGWENGYWHNESIDVNQSDGLTEAELNATVSRAMARVEVIRELEFEMNVPVEIVPRSEFASSSNASYSDDFRAFDNAKFEALFLIGEDEDSLAVQQANRGSSVAGYYSPAEDAIVLVTDNESTLQVNELTLGHELVHAVQDQEFDLGNISSETRDGANANNGLIEGDANLVQHRYRQRCGEGGEWNGTCLRPDGDGGGGAAPPNMGVYFLNYQPYSDGPAFIAQQQREGGWAAVNAIYNDTPASAEQVIHPERYRTDPPTAVELSDEHADNWERVRPDRRADYAEVGQTGVAAMLVYPLYVGGPGAQIIQQNEWLNTTSDGQVSQFDPLNYGFDAAAGWDGDRMHFYRNGDGEIGYVWRLVWDSDAEAEEFTTYYEQLLSYWGAESVGEHTYRIAEDGGSPYADAFHITVEGDTVTIVNAPSVDALTEVRASADPQVATPTPEPTAVTESSETADPVTEPSVTTSRGPGFSALAALLSVLVAALLVRRR